MNPPMSDPKMISIPVCVDYEFTAYNEESGVYVFDSTSEAEALDDFAVELIERYQFLKAERLGPLLLAQLNYIERHLGWSSATLEPKDA